MGYELVSDSFSLESRGRNESSAPHFTYTDRFNKIFPYYLSIGMTYEQFWNEDCLLVKAYREADKIKVERKNTEMWLQGRYVYEALLDVSPILHAFAKKGSKPLPYPSEPYAISQEEVDKKQESEERQRAEKMKAKLLAMANKNKKQGG